ncbi:MAG TPA: GNAT family N-acetyltransferase [Kofleriaceae bacterium]|nr:GNAT family N-acetyltransferase [Kofleriaceae bacterium]
MTIHRHIRSLALATDLALLETRARIVDRGAYLVVETPDDPSYYYGNLLVLPAPPRAGEVAHWTQRFADELGTRPEIRHVTLCWDGGVPDPAACDALVAAGFTLDPVVALAAPSLRTPPAPPGIEIRPLDASALPATAELAFALADRHDDVYRQFLQRRAAWQAGLVARGAAQFWGAFDGDRLVASLGLVTLAIGGARLGRFQDVQTAVDARKRGIASALVGEAARAAALPSYVVIALPGGPALGLYERAGFAIVEHTASACRYPAP